MKKLTRNKGQKFQIKVAFESGVDNAFKTITNPLNYPEIHPLINKVDKIDVTRFECHETTAIFGIPYRFKYIVDVNSINNNRVVMESEVQKGVWIRLSFSIVHFQYEQFLCEEIEVKGSYLVQKILFQKIKKAHRKMFHKLRQETEFE